MYICIYTHKFIYDKYGISHHLMSYNIRTSPSSGFQHARYSFQKSSEEYLWDKGHQAGYLGTANGTQPCTLRH